MRKVRHGYAHVSFLTRLSYLVGRILFYVLRGPVLIRDLVYESIALGQPSRLEIRPPRFQVMMHARQDDCAIILSLIIEGNASLDYVGTASAFYKRRNIYVDVAESCGVSLNRELRIIRV